MNKGDLGPSNGKFSQTHFWSFTHLFTQLFRCSPSTRLLSTIQILHPSYTPICLPIPFMLVSFFFPSLIPFLLSQFPFTYPSHIFPFLPTLIVYPFFHSSLRLDREQYRTGRHRWSSLKGPASEKGTRHLSVSFG